MRKFIPSNFSLNNIYLFISKLLVLFIVFDNARMGLAIPHVVGSMISLFRDSFLFIALLILFSAKRKVAFPKFLFLLLLFFPIAIFICITNIITGTSETSLIAVVNGIYWYCRPLFIFLVFYNLENITRKKCTIFITFFLNLVLLLFFLSAFFYFFFPFMLNNMYFKFRISLGNPSMIAAEYNAASIIILGFRPFSKLKNFVFLSIYIIACLLTMCATANFIMFIIIFTALFNKRTRQLIFPIVFILFSLIAIFLIFFQTSQTKSLIEFVQKRIFEITSVLTKYIFRNSSTINSDSFRGREAQLSRMLKTFPNYGFIFGIGDISGTGGKYSLENIYMATFSNYGFSGLIFYIVFLFLLFVKAIFYLFYKQQQDLFLFVIFITLYGITLDLINTYSLSGIFIISGIIIFTDKQFCFYKKDNFLFRYAIIFPKES